MESNSYKPGVQSVMHRQYTSAKDTSSIDTLNFPIDPHKINTRSMMRKGGTGIERKGSSKGSLRFEEQKYCQLCNSEFRTLINRRHHCRTCGKSVCGKCSKDKKENRICDMCITEDENKGLKELYEHVLLSKQDGLKIMKEKIQNLEFKSREKRAQLEEEKENYDKTIKGLEQNKEKLKETLKELKEKLNREMSQNEDLKRELQSKRDDILKRKDDQSEIQFELNKKKNVLQEKQDKLHEKEIELEKIKEKLLKYQDDI